MSSTNTAYALVADGSGGTTLRLVDFGVPTPGPFVPCSPAGSIGATPLATYNLDLPVQLAGFLAKYAVGQGTVVVALGDSTTKGFGATQTSANIVQLSYPSALVQSLNAQGIAASYGNFVGVDDLYGVSVDFRLKFIPTAQLAVPLAGGFSVSIQPVTTFGFTFALDGAAVCDQAIVTYLDYGTGTFAVALDGVAAAAPVQMHDTKQVLRQSLAFPLAPYTVLTATLAGAEPVYIQSAALANSSALLVYNAGSGGMTTGGELSPPGLSPLDGALALGADLALVNLGINDILLAQPPEDEVVASIAANLDKIITALQGSGAEVILFVPTPFNDPRYTRLIGPLRTALQALAVEKAVPLVDLSLTYGDSYAALNDAGLMSGYGVHPNATLYADIGSHLAALLGEAMG